jgi:hypothetical protein
MRIMAALIALITALATPARAGDASAERVDARMLLDLDLLAEADPAQHRDRALVERLRLLEVLPAIDAAAPGTSRRPATPPATRPPTTAPSSEGGTR